MSNSANGPGMRTADDALRAAIIERLRTVQDPEIPVNLYDLGLIYDLKISGDGAVHVRMTLTTPNCPVAESMPGQVRDAVAQVDGVSRAAVELVWQPPWTGQMMTDDAKMQLEMMGISWREPHRGRAGRANLTVGRKPTP